jgi:transcriptional regulator with XRE-family HTH domain
MLAKRLKERRVEKKLTQDQLAKIVNTKKTTISNYENQHSTPSNEMLSKLADALDCTSDYLLGRNDLPQQPLHKIVYKIIDESANKARMEYDSETNPYTDGMGNDSEFNPYTTGMENNSEFSLLTAGMEIKNLFNLDEQLDLFKFSQWKKLSPQHVKLINEHFKMVIKLAEEIDQ